MNTLYSSRHALNITADLMLQDRMSLLEEEFRHVDSLGYSEVSSQKKTQHTLKMADGNEHTLYQ